MGFGLRSGGEGRMLPVLGGDQGGVWPSLRGVKGGVGFVSGVNIWEVAAILVLVLVGDLGRKLALF